MQGHGHEEQGILFYSLLKHIASVIPVIFSPYGLIKTKK